MTSIFTTNSLEQAKSDFNQVILEADQSKILDDTAKIIVPHLDINILALKGFMLRAIKQWQSDEGMLLGDLVKVNPQLRISHMGKMLNISKKILTEALRNRTDSDLIIEAMDKAFETYKEKYAYR